MNEQVINKYNIPVPRYTSYPPANYFKELNDTEYLSAVDASNDASRNHVSFYCTFLIAIIYAIIVDVTRMRWPKNSKLISMLRLYIVK